MEHGQMPGDRTIGGEDDALNNFVSATGAGVHVPCAVRRSRADGCSVCVHWHVPTAPVAPEQLILRKEGAANTSGRGHHIFGRQIVDLVLERTRKLADNCIARRGFFVCNPYVSGLWSRLLATGLYGCRLRDEVACAVVR